METGERESIVIEDLTARGSGVGRGADGAAVFVRGALPGDTVTAECFRKKKKYCEADLISIDEPSSDRVESFCGVKECGGCPYAELKYEKQLEQKKRDIINDLERIGGIKDPLVNGPVGMEDPFKYRNKATLRVGLKEHSSGSGAPEPEVGFFKEGTHEVIDCPYCEVQSRAVTAIASSLRTFLMTADDREGAAEAIKDVIVRSCFATGEVMVVFEISGHMIPGADKLIDMMDAQVRRLEPDGGRAWSLESVYTVGRNKEPVLLAGKKTVLEELGEVKYEISPLSFYQVNPVQTERLYDKVLEYAGLSDGDSLLDLYCGVGSIGIYLSKKLNDSISVLGIETVKSAVLDANRNAVINGIVNARYMLGKAEKVLPGLAELQDNENIEEGTDLAFARRVLSDAEVAVVDPPRAGCAKELLEALTDSGTKRIVYVSCDPATLSRDVKILTEGGYRFVEATPVDMFPHTGHVETVCLLSQRKPDTTMKGL